MTRDECVHYLQQRGLYYADQPLTVTREVYEAQQARINGMLRAIEAHASSVARPPPAGVEWEVDR